MGGYINLICFQTSVILMCCLSRLMFSQQRTDSKLDKLLLLFAWHCWHTRASKAEHGYTKYAKKNAPTNPQSEDKDEARPYHRVTLPYDRRQTNFTQSATRQDYTLAIKNNA